MVSINVLRSKKSNRLSSTVPASDNISAFMTMPDPIWVLAIHLSFLLDVFGGSRRSLAPWEIIQNAAIHLGRAASWPPNAFRINQIRTYDGSFAIRWVQA
jgi:hypothetical protein